VLTHVHKKKASRKAFCSNHQVIVIVIVMNIIYSIKNSGSTIFQCNYFDTWNKVKWIRNIISWGRPNQNNLSVSCTTGSPLTTACLPSISKAISNIISCSFIPTIKTICTIKWWNGNKHADVNTGRPSKIINLYHQ